MKRLKTKSIDDFRASREEEPLHLPRAAPFILIVCSSLALASCATTNSTASNVDPNVAAMYAAPEAEPHRVPAVSASKIDPRYYRQRVKTPSKVKARPGTIVVDPNDKFLYLVESGGMSTRYGIGVGKAGFSWSGNATISDKQEWPKWFPPKEMQQRDLRAWFNAKGMEGGTRNPLGARALYLFEGKCNGNNTRTEACKDTLYRLHGTSDENSIGKAVSSGCIRLLNQDIIDLYERVPLGTKVVVLKGTEPPPSG